jgi:hypothetical protein
MANKLEKMPIPSGFFRESEPIGHTHTCVIHTYTHITYVCRKI